MDSVFSDINKILFLNFLPKDQTISSAYYIELLDRFVDAIKQKRPHMANKKLLLHLDNALMHKPMETMRPQKEVPGKEIRLRGEVIAAIEAYFQAKDRFS